MKTARTPAARPPNWRAGAPVNSVKRPPPSHLSGSAPRCSPKRCRGALRRLRAPHAHSIGLRGSVSRCRLVAFALGALLEHIADRQHVNILAFPLLAIVIWNVVVYVLLLLRIVMRASGANVDLRGLRRWLTADETTLDCATWRESRRRRSALSWRNGVRWSRR